MAHEPVMVAEVLDLLAPARGGLFVDCTVGLGGHSRALLDAGATRVLGLDRDPSALAIAGETLAPYRDRVELVHADYRELDRVLDARGIAAVDGTLADLGVSSMQLDAEGRGFS
ncbi:MAG TPA: 16S rRNA (cytosine(1402)-N(4))-methyltransferase, partial [Gemmatimonadales bacterium]|nr:16S rRNA (cytosine(1402)-N(4))-methyltransferase [Gemmatimonadales bacterium]